MVYNGTLIKGFLVLQKRIFRDFGGHMIGQNGGGQLQDIQRLSQPRRQGKPLVLPELDFGAQCHQDLLNAKVLPQIDAAHVFIVHDLFGGTTHQDVAVMQNIGPIHNTKGFADVVIRDQNPDPAVL